MTKFLLVFVPAAEARAKAALQEIRSLASMGVLVVDGPLKLEGPVPSADAARLTRAAEILERAAKSAKISEGLARAKAEGHRIGRPPAHSRTTIAEIVLARDSGASWGEIGHKYGIPRSSARRLYINELASRSERRASKREGGSS
jgi:putative DNA-invertase from lambdoid prophage Rac